MTDKVKDLRTKYYAVGQNIAELYKESLATLDDDIELDSDDFKLIKCIRASCVNMLRKYEG